MEAGSHRTQKGFSSTTFCTRCLAPTSSTSNKQIAVSQDLILTEKIIIEHRVRDDPFGVIRLAVDLQSDLVKRAVIGEVDATAFTESV